MQRVHRPRLTTNYSIPSFLPVLAELFTEFTNFALFRASSFISKSSYTFFESLGQTLLSEVLNGRRKFASCKLRTASHSLPLYVLLLPSTCGTLVVLCQLSLYLAICIGLFTRCGRIVEKLLLWRDGKSHESWQEMKSSQCAVLVVQPVVRRSPRGIYLLEWDLAHFAR